MDIVTGLLKMIFGSKADKDRKEIQPYVEKIKAIYPTIEALTNDELRARSAALMKRIADAIAGDEAHIVDLKAKLERNDISLNDKENYSKEVDQTVKRIDEKIEEQLDEILPEAFAIMKDTARRFAQNETVVVTANDFDRDLAAEKDFVTIEGDKAVYATHWLAGGNDLKWDMIHYDVQLFGGVVLHKGKIAEMATGEGKTLVATLPVFLNALARKGVHLVTVNDYLAKRDSEWMGPMYQFHGLSVDCIDKHQPNSEARRRAYMADITFGTNNEYGFDYLRDNMASSPKDLVQRKHHYAIVDEVDSVLIDDARTPLIISGPVPKGDDQLFEQYRPAIENLYNLQKNLVTNLVAEARQLMSEGKNEEGGIKMYRAHKGLPKYKPLIKFLSEPGVKVQMQKTENVYMADNNRRMPEITDDLFFVIDEKMNSVELTDKGHEALSRYFDEDGFFVLPDIGAEVAELEKQTGLTVEEKVQKRDAVINDYAIKSERVHTVNQLLKAYSMFEKDTEYVVMDNKVKIVDEQTGRILDGRRYSDGLHQAIEAKEHVKVEAATQTFATITLQNYFRMYHKLAGMTGTAETEAGELWDIYKLDVVTIPTNRPVARIDMDDRVYKTKKEKYAAVIDEIVRMRDAGRPVLVGTTSVEISELLKRMLDMRKIDCQVLNAKLHQQEAMIVANAGKKGMVTIATNMAGRGTDIKLTPEVKEAGGLAIIGTERHESRRVDRQLRGRAGRQGDPGSSVFFVSFEDQLMRLFATDRVMKMLDTLGLQEGEAIESKMVTNAIGNAQKRVEENNFGIRKRLLEYDDVMNKQRTYIYNRRHHALLGERIGIDIANMMWDVIENFVNNTYPADYQDLALDLFKTLTIEAPFTEDEFKNLSKEDAIERIHAAANEAFARKSDRIIEVAVPVITDCVENRGYKGRIAVPMTDGKRFFNLVVDLDEAYRTGCKSIVKEWHKAVLLVTIDELWKEHLRELDQLRQSVQNASYEQKDPLVIYKVESFHLFESMLNQLNIKAMSTLMRGQIYVQPAQPQAPRPAQPETHEPEGAEAEQKPAPEQPKPQPKVERAMPEKKEDYSQYRTSRENLPGEAANRAASQGASQRQAPQPAKAGPRINRNDPCPCGSGKKYKNCHGKGL